MKLQKVFVVVQPTELSEFGDLVWGGNFDTLENQILGGGGDRRISERFDSWYTDRSQAEKRARQLLRIRDRHARIIES